jgi:hypothetical protein
MYLYYGFKKLKIMEKLTPEALLQEIQTLINQKTEFSDKLALVMFFTFNTIETITDGSDKEMIDSLNGLINIVVEKMARERN